MFSRWRERLGGSMRFRLAWWYALIFVASSAMIVALTYVLLAAALRQYDHEIIQTTLVEFADRLRARRRRRADRARSSGPSRPGAAGPLFVRVGGRQSVVFLSMPEGWRGFDLSQLAEPGLAGEQRWATLETGVPGCGSPRGRVGSSCRRHALPGRQEHGAPHRSSAADSDGCSSSMPPRSSSSASRAARC